MLRAERYRAMGWSVIPCHTIADGGCTCGREDCGTPGKHPRISWRPYSSALPTRKEVHGWFTDEFYGSNVGMCTGQVSGIVVVDVDGPIESFKRLRLNKNTLVARSGGGGLHFFYRTKHAVRSAVGLVPGVDIRAEGGFIVLPRSVHKSGNRYEWLRNRAPLELDVERLQPFYAAKQVTPEGSTWYEELLNGVPEGERSDTASRLAGRYASLGLSLLEGRMIMDAWNSRNDPPINRKELRSTVDFVYRRHRESNGSNGRSVETVADLLEILKEVSNDR